MRSIISLLIVLTFVLQAAAQMPADTNGEFPKAPAFDRSAYEIQHKTFVLDNGLTLIVHTDHSVPIVGVNVWYHVGSRNEKRGKTGFAHMFEHFFFNGSENHPHGFREAMDDLGANNRNGTTNTDRTNFFEDVPVSALERTLYLEADRMGFLGGYISKEMLERERGVVKNEKRQGENRPYGRVFTEIVEKVYPYSHPYSWSTIGSMDDLNAATLEDVKEWYETYYGPNNAVLSLAGDITPERALELVNKYFGGIKPGPPLSRAKTWIPKFERDVRDEMYDRAPQARIYRVYHAPEWASEETEHLQLFADVLAGSKSARLDKRLVYEKGLATGVSAGMLSRELAGLFLVTITVKPGASVEEAEKEMDAVVAELVKNGPTGEEVTRSQNRNLAGFLRGIERLGGFGGRSDVLAEAATYGGKPELYLDKLENFATSTPSEVKTASAKWLTQHHYTMVVRPFPELAPKPSGVDRSILPTIGAAPEVEFPQVKSATLDNGLKIMLLERHSVPIVNAAMVVDAGFAADTLDKAGAASLASDLMDEGTATRSAFDISNELDMLGSSVSTNSGLDQSFVRLRSTKQNFGKAMEIFADVIVNPSFPDEQFDIQKQRAIAGIAQEKAQPNGAALRILPELLYGRDHSYGKPFSGSGFEDSVSSLTREDLAKWHSDWFRPNNATLIVTGDTTLDEVRAIAAKAFASWKQGKVPSKNIDDVPATKGGKVYLIDKPGAPQSTIVATHVSLTAGQPDEIAIETVMRNFGGMSTSRLNRNLRLDKHWSYGSSGFLAGARAQRPFIIIAPVQTDKTKESMMEVWKEIKGVAGERPLEGEEYESIMRNMSLRLPGRFETLSSLEGAAVDMVNEGLPADYWSRYAGRVRNQSADQLNAAAARYVRPDEIIWIIVGDLAKITDGVKSLGYGDVVRLDADGKVMP
ncbi:MAG: insulinase family protein [Acidobacteria bacterium]|nr:MAG: insulinase family protein [Acidobacteriota bacterium]REK02096.1 MAG: insulinase family protein [Acidobacteriota bacterium]REK15054.1 MAG: insulinase family protein [Acidobacteriota bacterium]REK45768.1 MAG: insulinase family protein [Acidobacteriota bacterium]